MKKVKYFISNIRFIVNHPLNQKFKIKAIFRYFKWIIVTKLNSYPLIYPFTDKAKLIIHNKIHASYGNLFGGLLEYQEMSFLLHFLRENDLFVDVGANVGSYTTLAAAHAGSETVSIEPAPSTFEYLKDNINVNRIYQKVEALNIALGSQEGTISFTKNLGAMNRVAIDSDKEVISVPVFTLDKIMTGKRTPVLLKIDVEGFENEVLKGASETLKNEELKAIIIELNGLGNRYGYDQKIIHQNLINLGFIAYNYNPADRELIRLDSFGTVNTIYVRDIDFVNHRIKTAEKVKLPNNVI